MWVWRLGRGSFLVKFLCFACVCLKRWNCLWIPSGNQNERSCLHFFSLKCSSSCCYFRIWLFFRTLQFCCLYSERWPHRLDWCHWRDDFLLFLLVTGKFSEVPVCRGIVLWKGIYSPSSPFLGVFPTPACALGEEPASLPWPPLASVGGNFSVHNMAERSLKISSDLWKKQWNWGKKMCYKLKTAINSLLKTRENTWKCFNLLAGYVSVLCSHTRYKTNMQMSLCPENNALETEYFLTRKYSAHQHLSFWGRIHKILFSNTEPPTPHPKLSFWHFLKVRPSCYLCILKLS